MDGVVVKPFEVIVGLFKKAIAAGSAQAEENLITFLVHGREGNLKNMEFRPAASDVEQILAYRKLQALDGSADSKNKYAKSIIICAGEGNRSEAYVQIEEILRDAVSLEPDSVESNVNLATTLGEVGKLDEAIAAFRTVLILQPGYEYVKFMLANLLSEQVYFVTIISENCFLRISS
jgi:tetratricopeptide (TPR) repeat protein